MNTTQRTDGAEDRCRHSTKRIDAIGNKYGRLTVVADKGEKKGTHRLVDAEGECGRAKAMLLHHLRSGHALSCGCMRAAMASDRLRRVWAIAKADGRLTAGAECPA